jgi:transposase
VVTLRWAHPAETPTVLDQLRGLPCGSLTAVMESTGVYGDTLRKQLREAGMEVHLMSAKRVHDACEVYDGVPSMHDAKAAQVIGRLYFEGASRVCVSGHAKITQYGKRNFTPSRFERRVGNET